MSLEELKAMFPDFHPEDYIMSVAACCGSCKKGRKLTYSIACPVLHVNMFPHGLCPQYERDTDIIYPLIMFPAKPYGWGQG